MGEDLQNYILLTEPQGEGKAVEYLHRRGFDPYVPVCKRLRQYTTRTWAGQFRRHVEITAPIFPGYLFLPLNAAWSFGSIHESPGLRRPPFLRSSAESGFCTLSDHDMTLIRAIEHRVNNPENLGLPFQIGDKVRLIGGAFDDLVAQIERLDGRDRIGVLMDLLGGRVRCWVSDKQIAPAM